LSLMATPDGHGDDQVVQLGIANLHHTPDHHGIHLLLRQWSLCLFALFERSSSGSWAELKNNYRLGRNEMSNEEMKNRHSTIVGLLSLLLLVVAFGGTSLICHVQKNKKEDKPAELCENAIKVEGNKVGVCRDEAFGYTNEEQNKISVVGYGFGNHEDGWEYSDERQTTFDGTYDWYDFADADPGTYRFTFPTPGAP